MSACISRHGEFSEHSLDESHTCTLCHVLDEEALCAEIDKLAAERDQLRQHILDIDAHATPYGDIPDDPGYVGTYLLTAGALHRALGKIGHTAPNCEAEAKLTEAHAELARYAERPDPDALRERAKAHLTQCGPHDYGLAEMGCGCPQGDPRPLIANMLDALERQAAELARYAKADHPAAPDLLYEAWCVIANAGWDATSGDTDINKTPGWHDAAIRWRDRYHAYLDTIETLPVDPTPSDPGGRAAEANQDSDGGLCPGCPDCLPDADGEPSRRHAAAENRCAHCGDAIYLIDGAWKHRPGLRSPHDPEPANLTAPTAA